MGTIFIHINPDREVYSLTEDELEKMKNASNNSWKDFSLVCFAIGVACILNAITEVCKQDEFHTTLSFNLNLVFGFLGIILGICFLIVWQRTKKYLDDIIKQIKVKPKIEFIQRKKNLK